MADFLDDLDTCSTVRLMSQQSQTFDKPEDGSTTETSSKAFCELNISAKTKVSSCSVPVSFVFPPSKTMAVVTCSRSSR